MKHTDTAPKIMLVFTDAEPGKESLRPLESSLKVRAKVFTLAPFWIVKINQIVKHLAYLAFGWKAFRKRRKARYLFFPQQAIAFYYMFLMRFISRRHHSITATPILYRERTGSSKDMQQAVLTLKNDKELCLRLGDLARTHYNEHYADTKYAGRIADLMKEVSTDVRPQVMQT
jgi:hypothetical protein